MTTGEISAHFAEIYGASVSKETVSRITDRVIEEMNGWSVRPLDEIYAAVFIDAIVVKVRDGQVANRPIYAAIGGNLDGERDILGLWAGTGGEGAKFWMSVLTDLRNRGVRDATALFRRPARPARPARAAPRPGGRAAVRRCRGAGGQLTRPHTRRPSSSLLSSVSARRGFQHE